MQKKKSEIKGFVIQIEKLQVRFTKAYQRTLKIMFIDSVANKYYSSTSHYEQKNKKTTSEIR